MRGLTDMERDLLTEGLLPPDLSEDCGTVSPVELAVCKQLEAMGLMIEEGYPVDFEDCDTLLFSRTTERGRLALRLDAIVRMGVAA